MKSDGKIHNPDYGILLANLFNGWKHFMNLIIIFNYLWIVSFSLLISYIYQVYWYVSFCVFPLHFYLRGASFFPSMLILGIYSKNPPLTSPFHASLSIFHLQMLVLSTFLQSFLKHVMQMHESFPQQLASSITTSKSRFKMLELAPSSANSLWYLSVYALP